MTKTLSEKDLDALSVRIVELTHHHCIKKCRIWHPNVEKDIDVDLHLRIKKLLKEAGL